MVSKSINMKKTLVRLAGLTAVIALFAFVGAGCTGGGDDAVKPPPTGANATDNPSVGQPVTSGQPAGDGAPESLGTKGSPGGQGKTKGG